MWWKAVLGVLAGLLLLCLCALVTAGAFGLGWWFGPRPVAPAVAAPPPAVVNWSTVPSQGSAPVIVPQGPTCGYDYSFMPTGMDQNGRALADHGVQWMGTISGPAIIQQDGFTVVAVFPGASFTGPGDTVWVYNGDSSCLASQFPEFPGKRILEVH